MPLNFAKTLELVKGGLLDHEKTWTEYLEENPGWQDTAMVLTGPMIVANIFLSVVFSRLLGGFSFLGHYGNFIAAVFWGLVLAILGFVIAVFAFNFLAGLFKGTSNFPRAFAAVSMAAIPAWTGGILAALLPAVGFYLAIGGGIISLVFLYKIMPLALGVPDDKRVFHFVASIVAIVILNALVGSVLGIGDMSPPQL
jgi:hypothetical protein